MSKKSKTIIGYIVFTIILALMIFFSVVTSVDMYEIRYEYNDKFSIILFIIFGLIFASNYWIAQKFTQKGYSRLKVRFIFSILVSLVCGIAIKIDLFLSGISMNFMEMFLIILLLGVVVFIASYGQYGKDLLDFNMRKKK